MAEHLIIRPEAEADLTDAFNWHEKQLEGLGSDFLNSVEAALFAIKRNPDCSPFIHRQIRRQLIRRFPYGIFYTQNGSTIVVIAVFHARRNPGSWRKRL